MWYCIILNSYHIAVLQVIHFQRIFFPRIVSCLLYFTRLSCIVMGISIGQVQMHLKARLAVTCLHSLCALFALCHNGVMSACFNSISVVKLLSSSNQWEKTTKDNWEKKCFGGMQMKETLMSISILKIRSSSLYSYWLACCQECVCQSSKNMKMCDSKSSSSDFLLGNEIYKKSF